MAPIWTSTTGPQGSFCRRSTSAWRASCPWRSGDNLRLRAQKWFYEIIIKWWCWLQNSKQCLKLTSDDDFAFQIENYLYSKFSVDDYCGSGIQNIRFKLSPGSCTTPRQLLVLLAALSSQTCSGSSKQKRFMHIPFNFIVIVFKTDKDLACFCCCWIVN